MGFAKPKISQPETVQTPPPVVSETLSDDTQQAYAQENSRKRGLLSTILTSRKQSDLVPTSDKNTTLG